MRILSFIFLLFLGFIAVLYTTIGLRFSTTRKKRIHLVLFFLMGCLIGIIGGFVVIYNLEITKNAVFFDIELSRWLSVTVLAILFGGVMSLFILMRIRKK